MSPPKGSIILHLEVIEVEVLDLLLSLLPACLHPEVKEIASWCKRNDHIHLFQTVLYALNFISEDAWTHKATRKDKISSYVCPVPPFTLCNEAWEGRKNLHHCYTTLYLEHRITLHAIPSEQPPPCILDYFPQKQQKNSRLPTDVLSSKLPSCM